MKKNLRLAILILTMAAGLWLLLSLLRGGARPNQELQNESSPPTNITGKDELEQKSNYVSKVVATNSNIAAQTNPTTQAQSGYAEKVQKTLEAKNVPIEFFGQVIDQDGNPLTGVKIDMSIRHWELSEHAESQAIRLQKESDVGGHFEVSGVTGDALDVVSLQKQGYELEPNAKRSFSPNTGFGNLVVFKMWSTNIHEQLITGEKSFHIIPDGRVYFINLTDGTIGEAGQMVTGDLKVWVKRPEHVVHGEKYDWACEVDAVDGGLLQEVDPNSSMFSAPVEGYVPLFQYDQKISSGWGDSTGTRRFYIMLHGGQAYGRMNIRLFAYYNNKIPGLIRIQYAINPSGSRVLH